MNRHDRAIAQRMEARAKRGICYFDLFDSPSVPQPDPAIGQAAQANAEIGKEALDFQKQVYEEGKPRQQMIDELSKQLAQQAISIQGNQAAQAQDYYDYLKGTFRPIEQSLANEAANFDTAARREELAAQAGADVEQASAVSDAEARRAAAAYGINPSDAAFSENLAGSSYNKALAKVGAMNNARVQARNEARALKFDVAGLGRNLPAAGTNAAQVALSAGNSALNAGLQPAINARADANLADTGYRTAIAGNTAAGQIYSGLYNSQLQSYNAQQQQDSGLFSALGTGAGLLLSASSKPWWLLSDERAKKEREPVDAELVLDGLQSIPVESWKYREGRGDGGAHVGPMAQDVHRQFGDMAAPGAVALDPVTMNGLTLAGIQALAKKVDRLEKNVGILPMKKARNTEPRRST